MALRSDLRRLAEHTASLKHEAEEVIGAATAEQWVWSPDANTWSMALILEHLNSVARQGLPRIEATIAQLRTEDALSDAVPKYGWFEAFFIRLLSPNPPFRVPVPSIYAPEPMADPARETGPAFLEALDSTAACIYSANGLDLKHLKMASPANPKLRLTVGAWLEGLVGHNDYHWLQVRALRSHTRFPRGAV
jgi:hypothetical protein